MGTARKRWLTSPLSPTLMRAEKTLEIRTSASGVSAAEDPDCSVADEAKIPDGFASRDWTSQDEHVLGEQSCPSIVCHH